MSLAISVKNEKNTIVVSGITIRFDKFNDKGKQVNSLLEQKCDVGKYFLLTTQTLLSEC